MTERSQEELERLERISRRVTPRAPSRGPKLAVGGVILVLLAVGAVWTYAPQQMRALLDLGASRPQDMQQPAGFDAGVSTEVPRREAEEAQQPLTTELPAPARAADGLTPEAAGVDGAAGRDTAVAAGRARLRRADHRSHRAGGAQGRASGRARGLRAGALSALQMYTQTPILSL